MRKSKFLLNLIAATAIGLTVFGCESSDTGGFQDATDIAQQNAERNDIERFRRAYFAVGQRGVENIVPEFGTDQSAPANAPGDVIAGTRDVADDGARATLFEIAGVTDVPLPNAAIVGPGLTNDATTPPVGDGTSAGDSNVANEGTTGYHVVAAHPGGNYIACASRAKSALGVEDVTNIQLQLFTLESEPLDVTFPPVLAFGNAPAATRSALFFPTASEQGRFMSGVWSPDGSHFYISLRLGTAQNIVAYAVNLVNGELRQAGVANFPIATGPNNPVKMEFHPSGNFMYALDNGNNGVVLYTRDAATGALTQGAVTATVSDPRGMSIDRSGSYLYVAGRESRSLVTYAIGDNGSLTQVPTITQIGNVPADFGAALGDVDCNPLNDTLALGTYAGQMQIFAIDPATGAITPSSNAGGLTGGHRNTNDVEWEPLGNFIVAVQEADTEEFQGFASPANGFGFDESNVFANIVSASNQTAGGTFSAGPQQDANGRTVYALPASPSPFTGSVQTLGVDATGELISRSSRAVENPGPATVFTKLFVPPSQQR